MFREKKFYETDDECVFWEEAETIQTGNVFLRTYLMHSKKNTDSGFLFRQFPYILRFYLMGTTDQQNRSFKLQVKSRILISHDSFQELTNFMFNLGFQTYEEARGFWLKHEEKILALAEDVMNKKVGET